MIRTRSYTLKHPQAVAWTVVLASFMLFCLFSLLGTFGAQWFLFESQVDLSIRLTVSKGRVDITLPDGSPASATRQDFVGENTILQVDSSSQGYLTFEDNYSKQLIATVFLMQGSSLSIDRAARPRFDWSENAYVIRLGNAIGRFVVDVPQGIERDLRLDVGSELGAARFEDTGEFRIYSGAEQLNIHADSGMAQIRTDSGDSRIVSTAQIGTIQRSSQDTSTLSTRPTNIEVLNANFGSAADITNNPALPVGWACSSGANRQNEPQGVFSRTLHEDQVALLMQRRGQGLDHAETSCEYTFTEGTLKLERSVTDYDSLSIRARIKVRAQDVTTCGIQGSECPVMIALDYLGENNTRQFPQVWRHGFYTLRPPTDDNPTTCDTCQQEHEKINPEAWYIYDSGDLFKLLPGNRRPLSLLRLRVYSSGHAYEAIVTDLAVMAGRKP
ncbi:MAG: hypothetical protein OHK0023_02840 [Anaerolineae bacterium]